MILPPWDRGLSRSLCLPPRWSRPRLRLRRRRDDDAASIKQALDFLRAGDAPKAQALADKMRDLAARALVQWAAIRLTPKDMGFEKHQRVPA